MNEKLEMLYIMHAALTKQAMEIIENLMNMSREEWADEEFVELQKLYFHIEPLVENARQAIKDAGGRL